MSCEPWCEKRRAWSTGTQRPGSPPLTPECAPLAPLHPKLYSNLRKKIAPKNPKFKNVPTNYRSGKTSWLPGLSSVLGQALQPGLPFPSRL